MEQDTGAQWESRLQETETRLAFLERELDVYKEAVQDLHERLQSAERALRALREEGEAAPQGSADEAASADGLA